MKIGMILDNSFPPDSRVENEAVSLIAAGHEVFLFSLDYQRDKPSREIINGIKVYRYFPHPVIYKLSALAYSLPFFRKLITPLIQHFIDETKPDVVHIHDMLLGRTGILVARKNNLPVVLDLHENRPVIMRQYAHLKKLPGRLMIWPSWWEKAQKDLVLLSEKIVVVTEEAKNQLLSDYNKLASDVIVVPNTIHPDIYLSYPVKHDIIASSSAYTLLYMGDTGLRRGTDTAIKSLKIIRNKGYDVRLVLVGSNTEDYQLNSLVKELQMQPYVLFEGWQDVSKFPSYTAVSDICLSPLKRNLHHDTTYANKIFQYMAMGKPVVVSDCPAQARVITETQAGLVHRAGDPTDLASKIITLLDNSPLRKKMGDNAAQAVITKWNWKNTSKDLILMYKSFP
jgi:glycosyltransferase involved in cell wall biosynthesis